MLRFLLATIVAGSCLISVADEIPTIVSSNVPSIVAAGTVVDANGRAVPLAHVTVIGTGGYAYVPHRHPGLIDSQCDSQGRFRITWPQSDRRFLQSPNAMLVAHDGVDSMVMVSVSLQKLLAGVPISMKLADGAPDSIRVLDSDGQPIPDARVSAAKLGSLRLPFRASDSSLVRRSDVDGVVTFPGASSLSLSHVYVTSPTIGNQCLQLTLDEQGQRVVVAQSTSQWSGDVALSGTESQPIDWTGLTMTFLTQSPDDGAYVWSETPVHASGTFTTGPLGDGELRLVADFPDSLPLAIESEALFNFKRPDPGQPIKIPMQWATAVKGKIIDAVDGRPLENIFIQVTDPRPPVFSNSDGTFTFFHDQSRINYYPTDALGRHVIGGAFYIYPQGLPEDHKLQIEPTTMQATSLAIGKVVDADGNPISGATVRCEYKVERFDYQAAFYSDVSGEFHFPGVTDGTGVTLSATTDDQMTPLPIGLVLKDDSRPVLTVHPRHGLRIVGNVVDSEGQPVPSARVTVRYPEVNIKEFQSGLDTVPTDAFADSGPILTDVHGRFASPPTLDWQRKFSVAIQSPGKRTIATYWLDASEAGERKSDLDLGVLAMPSESTQRTRTIEVFDKETGEPIEAARVVILGSLAGQATARTGADGRALLTRPDGLQVLAVDAGGYRPAITTVDLNAGPLPKISMVRPGAPIEPRVGASHDAEVLRSATMELLKLVPPPFPSGTPHRQRLYYSAMAYADFDGTLAIVKAIGGKDAENNSDLGNALLSMPWLTPKQISSAMTLADEETRFYLVLEQAKRSKDKEQKLELLGEAIVMARARSGDDQLYAFGYIADQLLDLGETELVKELIAEAWESHPELATVIENAERKKERKPLTGIARIFAPVYALVDFDVAMELIKLAAMSGEIEPLQAKAKTYVAAYDDDAWQGIAQRTGSAEISPLGLGWFRKQIRFATFDDGVRVMSQVGQGNDKIESLLNLAESDVKKADGSEPSDAERLALAAEVLEILEQKDTGYTDQHVSSMAARGAKMVSVWDPEMAERFLFAAIWNCNREPTILPMNVTATLAAELAEYDRAIAEALVSPCFDDWSWLFEEHDRDVVFRNNGPIKAAAAIDPKWAVELATDLCERHFGDEPSRKYETIGSIVSKWSD